MAWGNHGYRTAIDTRGPTSWKSTVSCVANHLFPGELPVPFVRTPYKKQMFKVWIPTLCSYFAIVLILACFGECQQKTDTRCIHCSAMQKPTDGKSKVYPNMLMLFPIGSMYGIFTYIYHKNQPNVGKYTIHGSCGFLLPNKNSLPGKNYDFFK